jgi:hypothetical protein
MEQRTATIPFDLETAKKINIGEIAGRRVVRGLLQWPHGHRQQVQQ